MLLQNCLGKWCNLNGRCGFTLVVLATKTNRHMQADKPYLVMNSAGDKTKDKRGDNTLTALYFILTGLIGYFLGAIPFGYLYVRITKKEDLRTIGSGRTGGTNTFRAAGLGVAIFSTICDVAKGWLAVEISRRLFGAQLGGLFPWAVLVAGSSVVIGHNWSIFLKWGGGAGTAPNVGWAAALWWPMFPISFVIMLVFLVGLGIASVASLAMGAVIPLVFGFRYFTGVDSTPAYFITGLITLAIVTWALRPNIKRLVEGNERVVGPRAKRLAKR